MWFIQQNYKFVEHTVHFEIVKFMLEVCPVCPDTSANMTTPVADSGINDRLVKLRPLIDGCYC